MRIIPCAIFLVLFCICCIPFVIAINVMRLINKDYKGDYLFYWVTWALRTVTAMSGLKPVVKGKENIPADEAVLFVSNHQSYFDIIVSYGLMERPTGYVSKDNLAKVPVLAQIMTTIHCLFLDRKDLRKGLEMINDAAALIKSGVSIMIYPEGTRTKDPDQMLEFHKGSFKIAQRAGCAIIPVTMVNTRSVFEAHFPWISRQPVSITYGEPVRFKELDKEDQKNIHLYVKNIIEQTYIKEKKALLVK